MYTSVWPFQFLNAFDKLPMFHVGRLNQSATYKMAAYLGGQTKGPSTLDKNHV